MAFVFSRNERVYVIGDASGGQPIFSTAALSPVNGDYVCAVRSRFTWGNELLRNPCKTGSLSQLAGVRGRGTARWELQIPVQGSGAAGTPPDCDPLLAALFGTTGVIVVSTSVTYALSDVLGSMTIYSFWQPSTASHLAAFGAIIDEMRVAATPDLAQFSFSGPAVWVIDSNDFSGLSADEKGGLGAFPAEPASPVSNGTPVVGFLGSITIDGTSTFSLISWNLTYRSGAAIDHVYGKFVPTLGSQDRRTVSLDFRVRDEDIAALNALKVKLRAKTAFDVSIVQGTTAGNIWTWTARNLQFGGYEYDDSANRREFNVSGGVAAASSATAKNELGLVLT